MTITTHSWPLVAPAGIAGAASESLGAIAAAIAASGGAGGISEAVLGDLWAGVSDKANAFCRSLAESLARVPDAALAPEHRAEILADFQRRVALSLVTADEMRAACKKVADKERSKAAAAARRRAGGGGGRGAVMKEPTVDAESRALALAYLRNHNWDVYEAASGTKKGYLTPAHLKQLCIYKGVYDSIQGFNTANKMQLLKPLLSVSFEEEKAAAAAEAADTVDTAAAEEEAAEEAAAEKAGSDDDSDEDSSSSSSDDDDDDDDDDD